MVLSELTKVMALNMRETEDQLSRDVLASTAFVINCTNGSNSDNPTEVTLTDVQIVIRRLLANDARTLSNIIQGTDRFGKQCAEVKLSLIDLEAYGISYGDRAQA